MRNGLRTSIKQVVYRNGGAADEDAIRKALLDKLPGVSIEFIPKPGAKRPSVAEALVPHGHSLTGMTRQDFGKRD